MENNIYKRMLAIQSELATVAKNLTVSTGAKSSYRAVGEKDILDAVKPLEQKYGVYSYPVDRDIVDSGEMEKQGSNGYSTISRYLRIRTVYRFVNIDNPDDHIDILSYADGIDSGDKATGKAMTYCDKYALMKAYKISTGEDPDQKASEEYTAVKKDRPSTQDLVMLRAMASDGTINEMKVLEYYNVQSFEELSKAQAKEVMKVGYQKRAVKASEGA